MIRKIEVKNYKSLKNIKQNLDSFQVLVGPNASGKTTFMDVVSFLSDLINNDLDIAIQKRTDNFFDLTFNKEGGDIEFVIELELPNEIKELYHRDLEETLDPFNHPYNKNKKYYDCIRYEFCFGFNVEIQENIIKSEKVVLFNRLNEYDFLIVLVKKELKLEIYPEFEFSEISQSGIGFNQKRNIKKSALLTFLILEYLPATTYLKNFLQEDIDTIKLDSQKLLLPSNSGSGLKYSSDGSNLPVVIEYLKIKYPENFHFWLEHIQTALPDITDIEIVIRPEDRKKYIRIKYNNLEYISSWMISDGTLRLLALTIPAYLPDFQGIYYIEEPENGIHPRAIETVIQSLTSIYNAQILIATHSSLIISILDPENLLCFSKNENGETQIIKGSEHPLLSNWHHETNLGTLYASGILD